jgi:hypothetical protein
LLPSKRVSRLHDNDVAATPRFDIRAKFFEFIKQAGCPVAPESIYLFDPATEESIR